MQTSSPSNDRLSFRIGALCLCFTVLCAGCSDKSNAPDATEREDVVLAQINGQPLTQRDFERSQAWLPSFARQLDASNNIDVSRFWSLVQLVRIAQDAEEKSILSDAKRSLAIKEALAAHNIQSIVDPDFVVTDDAIAQYLAQHGDSLKDPAAYTVNYALVKNANRVPMLYYGWHFARGAQLGYNFTKSEPLPKTRVAGIGQTQNEAGRPIDGRQFNFVYVRTMQEDDESPAQIGPFTASDDVLFSCQKTISILETAEVGLPIASDLACSGQWHAFVIPAWKRAAAKMDDDKARQIAIENIRRDHNEAYRAEKLGDNK